MSSPQVRTPLMSTWRGWWPRHQGPSTSPCSSPCLERGSTEQTPRTSSATPLPASMRRDLVSRAWTKFSANANHSYVFKNFVSHVCLCLRCDPRGPPERAADHHGRPLHRWGGGRAVPRGAHWQEGQLQLRRVHPHSQTWRQRQRRWIEGGKDRPNTYCATNQSLVPTFRGLERNWMRIVCSKVFFVLFF